MGAVLPRDREERPIPADVAPGYVVRAGLPRDRATGSEHLVGATHRDADGRIGPRQGGPRPHPHGPGLTGRFDLGGAGRRCESRQGLVSSATGARRRRRATPSMPARPIPMRAMEPGSGTAVIRIPTWNPLAVWGLMPPEPMKL